MIDLTLPGVKADDVYFLVIGLVGVAIMAVLGKSYAHQHQFAVRVKLLQERRAQLRAELTAPRKRQKPSSKMGIGVMRHVVDKFNLLQKSQIGKINRLLNNAGFRSKDAIYVFAFFQLVCPIFAVILAFLLAKIDLSDPFAVKWKPLVPLFAAYVGFKFPRIMVANKRAKRYYAIQKSLSDTLDLMMICAEAGLSLAASLDRVARELHSAYPEMAEELSLTSIELGFLPDRKRALANFAERVDMAETRGIAAVLVQTEKYGTPVAQALRVLAAEFRTQRMLRAEQKAARLPAIMTVPMILFILPTLFVVVLAPALIKLMYHI